MMSHHWRITFDGMDDTSRPVRIIRRCLRCEAERIREIPLEATPEEVGRISEADALDDLVNDCPGRARG